MPDRPSAPGTLPLGQALDHNTTLATLLQRVQAGRARYDALHGVLPAELLAAARPGPLLDDGWTLLADGPTAAAKLRQWLPRIVLRLQEAGHPDVPVRVKVLPRIG
jgi:hypothetical protein